jgi:hypothetical protein
MSVCLYVAAQSDFLYIVLGHLTCTVLGFTSQSILTWVVRVFMYEERSMHIKKDFPVHRMKLNLKYLKKERNRFENRSATYSVSTLSFKSALFLYLKQKESNFFREIGASAQVNERTSNYQNLALCLYQFVSGIWRICTSIYYILGGG